MKIVSIITIAVLVVMTGYIFYMIQQQKNKLTSQAGMMISLASAVMSALISGFLFGVFSGDLFLSAGISMLIGFTIGFAFGQPFGLGAILNGALPGLISGIIGSFLGLLLQFTAPAIMLGILLLLSILSLGLVILYIKVETNETLSLDTRAISPFAILGAGVVLIAAFLFLFSSDYVKIPGNSASADTQSTASADTQNSASTAQSEPQTEVDLTSEASPTINMKVTATGYTPNVIHVKKGVPVKLFIDNPLDARFQSE
jgi:glucan phosphoethanolaminetransferase (alkaline phosphatase superfamily)